MEFDLMEPSDAIKCTKTRESQAKSVLMTRLRRKLLTFLKKGPSPAHHPSQVRFVKNNHLTLTVERAYLVKRRKAIAQKSPSISRNRNDDNDANVEGVCLVEATGQFDRICQEMCYISDNNEENAKIAVKILDRAMNLLQSDFISVARSRLQDVSELVSKHDSRDFKTPSWDDLQILERGEELFWTWGGQKSVSCSVKHGIILLDSSNAHFYSRLVNILGAFATETSEFQVAEKSFTVLIELHGISNSTSRLLDMGAAFNNRGCISLIRGEYKQASGDFQNALRHLHCSKNKQISGSAIHSMLIAVRSNICRLNMLSRHFSKAVTEQERLVEECKIRDSKLPFQTAFMVLLNQATMYKTLAMFPKAEKILTLLKTLCEEMRRDECDLLLNFVHLQLGEVLLLRAKQKETSFPFEALTSASMRDLLQPFEGLHLNVRIESFEKLIEVLVQVGKIKLASELLEKGLKTVKNVFGIDHFNVASLLYEQGMILKLTGELSSALSRFQEAEKIWRQIFCEKHPLLINCYMSLGEVTLRLGGAAESHLYFQRAMENVEIIHQVSLPNQLSKRYLAMTRDTKDNALWEFQRSSEETPEGIVEGLVAEHGLALAVLANRLGIKDTRASRKKREKGKQPKVGKAMRVQNPEYTLIISQKCMRDLLQSGKKFLQQGMTKEAVAFFKEASRYGITTTIGCPNAALIDLYTIISQADLKKKKQPKSPALRRYLEDVKAETEANANENSLERSPEDEEMLTFDNQMTLKLLLTFFLLLCIQLQAHDDTFAAYDFYASQFPNDEQCFLTLDGELQVYASRTSVTCNGQTAVQDVFVSSAIFENKCDWRCLPPKKPLFRSLARRSNKSSCNLIAALSSPFFMDVDDVKKLEQKVLLSFQEFFQLKSLGFEITTTQAVVDLTSYCEPSTKTPGSRIELLPLCLLEPVSQSKIPNESRIISEMNPGLCERITCMKFTDKQTTCAMFSKISLLFLKNCTWKETSTLRAEDECLVLTVLDPVRARVTLWHKDISIMQKVQVIRITDKTTELDEIRQEPNFGEDFCRSSRHCCKAVEHFAIERFEETLTNTHGIRSKACEVRRQCAFSDDPQYANDNTLKAAVPPSKEFQLKGECSSVYSEENEAARTDIQVSTLEILTEISRLSRQLSENEIQPEDDNVTDTTLAALDGMASPPDEEPNGGAEEIISGNFELTTCRFGHDNERNNLASLKVGHSMSTEPDQLSLEEDVPVVKANEDAVTLGRTLFEEDLKLRRSFITEFQERLRKNEMCQEMKSKGLGVSSNEVSNGEISSLVEGPRDDASQSVFGKNNVAIFGGEDEEDKDQSDRKKEHSTASCEVSKGHENPGIIQNDKRKESENRGRDPSGPEPLINSVNQKRTGEEEARNDKTAVGKILPSPGDMNVIANEPCGVSTSDFEAGLYHCHREGTCKVQMGTREIYQDEVFEESLVDRNGVLQKRESIQTNDKDKTQSKCSINRKTTANDVPKEGVEDGGEASVSGSLKKNVALFHGDQTRSLPLTELAMKIAESHVESRGKMFPRQLEDGRDSDTCGELGQEAVKNGWDKEFSVKAEIGTRVLPPLPSESRFTVGCSASNSPPPSSKDVVDGPNSPNSNTQDQEKVETSVQPLSPGKNDAESGYPNRSFSQTADQVFNAPPFLVSEDNSKDWMQPKLQSTFYGGDAVADGYTPELPSQQSEHVAVRPALKAVCSYQKNVKKERIILEGGRAAGGFAGIENFDEQKHIRNHCPNNFGDPDVTDGPVEQTSSNYSNICHLPPNFGGARPKQGFFVAGKDYSPSAGQVDFTSAYLPGKIGCGLDPEFVERHAVNNSVLTSRLYNTYVNGATWGGPRETIAQEHCFSARTFGTVNSMPRLTAYGSLNNHLSKSRHSSKDDVFAGSSTIEGSLPSKTMSHVPVPEQDKSWHFPSPPVNSEHFVKPGNLLASDRGDSPKYFNQETWLQDCEPVFDDPTTRSPYQEMRSLADEYMIEQGSQGEALEHSESCTKEHSFGVSELMPHSNQGSQETLLECLRTVMSTTVSLFASNNVSEGQVKQDKSRDLQAEKLSIQEEAVDENCDRTETDGEEYLGERTASLPRNERTTDTEEEDHTSPVQESPRPACGHYQRRCLVRFPCCGRFYPCHRCHNESAACTDDQARAINATHIRCTICYHEQVIDQGSQQCRGCNSKLADYFCAICKHFTSLDKNPFHCDKCGICRIHRDKSFHCNVCNVCLDKRLQGKHKCRPDSGHDECCICLEDAFSGCQILPCSHKVHKDCAIAMIQNGIRTCPICRHPLFQQSEGSEQ